MTFEPRQEGIEEVDYVHIRGKSQCKGPEEETSLVCCKEQQGGRCGYSKEGKGKAGGDVFREEQLGQVLQNLIGFVENKALQWMGSHWRVMSKGVSGARVETGSPVMKEATAVNN